MGAIKVYSRVSQINVMQNAHDLQNVRNNIDINIKHNNKCYVSMTTNYNDYNINFIITQTLNLVTFKDTYITVK